MEDGEGPGGPAGQDRLYHYRVALGSALEAKSQLGLIVGLGLVDEDRGRAALTLPGRTCALDDLLAEGEARWEAGEGNTGRRRRRGVRLGQRCRGNGAECELGRAAGARRALGRGNGSGVGVFADDAGSQALSTFTW